jgi:hypothetical protein
MLSEALQHLRLDRRLVHRRGWLAQEELERALAALPDVSDKRAEPPPAPASSPAAERPAGD